MDPIGNRRLRVIALTAWLVYGALGCGETSDEPQTSGQSSSQDGSIGKIAFVSNRDGNKEIYVVNSDGSGLANLTNSSEDDGDSDPEAHDEYRFSWSPDGHRIVFETWREDIPMLYLMEADGSNQSRLIKDISLTIDLGLEGAPKWSPNGELIAFAAFSSATDNQICVARADGSELTCLPDENIYESALSWSPDSKKLAFHAFGSVDSARVDHVYVMNADGSNVVRIADNASYDSKVDWSPDSWRVAFNSYWGANADIYVADQNGQGPVRLTDDPAPDLHPAWSPDGGRIVFSSRRGRSADIYLMDADGSNLTRLTDDGDHEFLPAWSPDGTQIAFVTETSEAGELSYEFSIVVVNADGSNRKVVADSIAGFAVPQWAPSP